MAKQSKYPVHPDFAHYPSFPFPFNGIVIGILNQFLHFDTWRQQRHIKRKAISHQLTSADGLAFDVLQFNPDGADNNEKLPAIVYYHGGAFVLTYASTHVAAVDDLAQKLKCRVFLVDYRLSPKHLFPKGFDDCYAALEWVHDNANRLAVDAGRIAVMGDSAGGGFAATVAQKALDLKKVKLCAQVLIYPTTDRSCSTRTAREYVGAPMFDSKANTAMWAMYLKAFDGKNVPPYAAAQDRENLEGLPKAYVETAEFDPLCDEGADYAKRMQTAGVNVVLHETKGTVHGYDTVMTSAITQNSLKRRVEFLQGVF
jgi:acetyl esterase